MRRGSRRVATVLAVVVVMLAVLVPNASAANQFAGRLGIGLNGISFRDSAATQQADARKVAATGATWVRLEADWWYVQGNGPTSYDWSGLDTAVAAARGQYLNVLMLVQKTPPWARTTTNGSTPPTDVADYAKFAAAVVARYAPQGVVSFEVWNEPNLSLFWADPVTGKPDVAKYVALLKAAYPRMKAATNRPINVLSAGLSPYGTTGYSPDGRAVSPLTFLSQMYAAGAKNYFDAVGWHPYTAPILPNIEDDANAWSQMSVDFKAANGTVRQKSARTIMTDNGDGAKLIVMTEAGAPTSGSNSMTEATQATAYQQAVTARAGFDWAGPIFFYTVDDYAPTGVPGPDRENYFGVYRIDGSAKPAVAALQSVS